MMVRPAMLYGMEVVTDEKAGDQNGGGGNENAAILTGENKNG